MQEFIYYNENGLDIPLYESIAVSNSLETIDGRSFVVSNSKETQSEVYAPEIDFYIRNTQDPLATQIKNIHTLYESAAIKYDYAQDISYEQTISNRLIVIVNDDSEYEEFAKNIDNEQFDMLKVPVSRIKDINGHIGDLQVVIAKANEDIEVTVGQIVWFDAQELGLKQSGCFDPNQSSIKEVVTQLQNNIEHFEYRKFTTYDPSICQYHERREEICSKCEEVCPTVAIIKEDETKHLIFSQIDCHGCGGCISVCPSGALDYAPSNRESIFEMSKLFKDTHPLIIPQKMDIENLNIPLKEGVLPFSIDGEKFMHEGTFLSLAQLSNSQIIFYSDFLSKGVKDAIDMLNNIYQIKYNKDCIIVAMNEEELTDALEKVSFVEKSYFYFDEKNLKKREIFALRLQHIVGNENLGAIETKEHIHYGKVEVNEANCTLCLVCVGACNVDALVADAKDNTLRINPSICTSCGYCEVSCPEKDCLTIKRDVIELEPNWFKENILAKDELFACVECGKEFATNKSIQKIAQMMAPLFSSDPVKERSLYCCADCKPKIMMQNYFDMQTKDTTHAK